jgi:DNA repair exonuclease SbcCD ATPase subunit
MGMMLLLRAVFFCGLVTTIQAGKVTPMQKVITLLKDLTAKVTEEGKKEAAAYDKYACFCKEQASDKLYAIEKSKKKIADLNAFIELQETEIAKLNQDISKLSKKVSKLEEEIATITEKREKEHAEYLVKATDMQEAIDACAAAIAALKDSKAQMKGAKLSSLVQVTGGLVKAVRKQPLLAKEPTAVALLSKLEKPGEATRYQYQSNDIIFTLETLLAKFKDMKKELDNEEFDINAAFETTKLGLANEKKFAEKEKAEKEAIVATRTEQMEEAKTDLDNETKDMNADQSFLDVLTKDCEDKAQLFDQRSLTRADELKALTEATAALEEGAVPNWSANKKLVGLQKGAVLLKAATPKASPVSLVQIESVQHQRSGKEIAVQRALSFLAGKAERSGSAVLYAIAGRIQVSEDHFVKVRGLIKDLIQKLKDDAAAEAEQKGMCDTAMAKAIGDRDEAQANIEVAMGRLTVLNAKKKSLEEEIDTLNKAIAGLKKALLEATELRAEEKADNEKTIQMATEGKEAVELALNILKDFYDNAFMQVHKYVPPDSDREGNTVGDLAPATFGEKYHGAQSESKGIVGILEVLLSDFERTIKKTTDEEADAQAAFEEFEKDTNDEIKEKSDRIKEATGELKKAEADILEQEQALSDAKGLLESAQGTLKELEPMCVAGEETWEERKKAREEEVEALKAALEILEDWQNPE